MTRVLEGSQSAWDILPLWTEMSNMFSLVVLCRKRPLF